ncbi:lysyl oxidase family protein [Actinokineospora sp.]|uniref:lysyl oxidase family protein n=1 Tax=Actinokineospora sp. TaxID=1872133 RepID=UPI003D6AB5F4
MSRWFATAVTLLSAGMLVALQSPAAAATPKLPDLGMAKLTDLTVTRTVAGQQQLRFSATVVNVGAGPFRLVASRPDQNSAFAVSQRIENTDGSATDTPTAATMTFGSDSHGHYHVKDLETYTLHRLDNGAQVGASAKGGFCFMDTNSYRLSLPGAPQQPVYTSAGCGHHDSTSLSMGLSVGWGDKYSWTLSDQFYDITGVPEGRYRLRATADGNGLFAEANDANNETWVDLQLTLRRGAMTVRTLGYGPVA